MRYLSTPSNTPWTMIKISSSYSGTRHHRLVSSTSRLLTTRSYNRSEISSLYAFKFHCPIGCGVALIGLKNFPACDLSIPLSREQAGAYKAFDYNLLWCLVERPFNVHECSYGNTFCIQPCLFSRDNPVKFVYDKRLYMLSGPHEVGLHVQAGLWYIYQSFDCLRKKAGQTDGTEVLWECISTIGFCTKTTLVPSYTRGTVPSVRHLHI